MNERSAAGRRSGNPRSRSATHPRFGLALAGGGPLGAIYEIGALSALTEALEGMDFNDADVYVGVSAGGFIAAALANGITPHQLSRVFIEGEKSTDRFEPSILLRPAFREYAKRLASVPPLAISAAWHYLWALVRSSASSASAGQSPPASSAATKLTGTCPESSAKPAGATISGSCHTSFTWSRPTSIPARPLPSADPTWITFPFRVRFRPRRRYPACSRRSKSMAAISSTAHCARRCTPRSRWITALT
jgi:hypothetical protein